MNYSEITNLAEKYSGRSDTELTDRFDDFLSIAEARINRLIKVQQMAQRSYTTTIADAEYIALPTDFNGLRDIEVRADDASTIRHTPGYLSPEQMNIVAINPNSNLYYTIIADQLQIHPPQDGQFLELVYYQKVPALTATDTTNWLSDDNPDAYIAGLMVEVSTFEADMESLALWEGRFQRAMVEMKQNDKDVRWSSPSLTIRAL